MTEIEKLEQTIRHELPGASISIDEKVRGPQFAWLDVEYDGRSVAVEWREREGFGVSLLPENSTNPCEGLFEGPDEVFTHWTEAKDHILLLLAESSAERRPKRAALGKK
jgi:hypothetical protein